MAFEIKRHDRRPRFRAQLLSNGAPVDLTGAVAVRFIAKTGSTLKVNRAAMAVVSTSSGIVEYAWAAGDTDTAGDYTAEIEVDWGNSEYMTFPSSGYFTLKVNDDLA